MASRRHCWVSSDALRQGPRAVARSERRRRSSSRASTADRERSSLRRSEALTGSSSRLLRRLERARVDLGALGALSSSRTGRLGELGAAGAASRSGHFRGGDRTSSVALGAFALGAVAGSGTSVSSSPPSVASASASADCDSSCSRRLRSTSAGCALTRSPSCSIFTALAVSPRRASIVALASYTRASILPIPKARCRLWKSRASAGFSLHRARMCFAHSSPKPAPSFG
mmetsp:Transcript_44294/g.131181  ORF Transcript_44294/g.131181 Transcript_44294/m.131181 type:complete len:229 (-) Transcript_44294:278-964(-)